MKITVVSLFLFSTLSVLSSDVIAAPGALQLVTVETNEGGGQTYTLSLQIIALMTVLTLLPALLLSMTSFTRIIIVLAIMRQALGTQQTPSNQILLGLALFLTIFIIFIMIMNNFNQNIIH